MENIHKMNLLLDFYGHMLPEKQRNIMNLYFEDDLSLSEIAGLTGITRQAVFDHIRKAEVKLKNLEDKMMLVEKSIKTKEGISKALELINSGECSKAAAILKEMLKEYGSF